MSPKRIVFEKDTGIFFTSAQEIRLLVKLKQLESCEAEKNYWIMYSQNADKQMQVERASYDSLNKVTLQTLLVAKDWEDRYKTEFALHEKTRQELSNASLAKKRWRKASLIAGVIAIFEGYLLTR